jgi:hypothetical protein
MQLKVRNRWHWKKTQTSTKKELLLMYCERCERVDYKYSKQNIRHEILIGAINLISMFFDYNDGVIGVHIDEHCMLLGGCSIYNIA